MKWMFTIELRTEQHILNDRDLKIDKRKDQNQHNLQ